VKIKKLKVRSMENTGWSADSRDDSKMGMGIYREQRRRRWKAGVSCAAAERDRRDKRRTCLLPTWFCFAAAKGVAGA
jgi:hypothetical protein